MALTHCPAILDISIGLGNEEERRLRRRPVSVSYLVKPRLATDKGGGLAGLLKRVCAA